MFIKYASLEEILEIKTSNSRLDVAERPGESFLKFAALEETSDGFLYVRCRAISSRVNKNNDGWPSDELSKSYHTFLGKPIFIDHNNDNPERTRGVIVDSRLHVEDDKESSFDPYYATAPDNHKPPTWIELLLEVDAKTFPKLASAIKDKDIDAVSMGSNIAKSKCSICENEADSPSQYCEHLQSKGVEFEIVGANGEKQKKLSYEDCYGVQFFEISFVFDPADPTALITEKTSAVKGAKGHKPECTCGFCEKVRENQQRKKDKENEELQVTSSNKCPNCESSNIDKVLKEAWDNDNLYSCLDCKKNYRKTAVFGMENPPDSGEDEYYDMPGAGQQDPAMQEYYQQPEDERVYQWRLQQLLGLGVDPTQAEQLARNFNFDYHELEKLVTRGWPVELAIRTVSSVQKTALPNDTSPSVNKEFDRQINTVPQADMPTAPEKVDTLRKEPMCPNCKSDSLTSDPDGTLKCQTCSYVKPPHPLDNPDLSPNREEEQEQQGQQNGQQQEDLGEVRISPMQNEQTELTGTPSNNPFKSSVSDGEINRMKWSTVYNGAIVETTVENPDGINSKTFKELRELGLTAKVTYSSGEEINIPFDHPAQGLALTLKAQSEGNLESVADVQITVEAALKDIDEVLNIIHGATAQPSVKKILNPHIQNKTDDPQNAKVISDQLNPVKSNEEDMETEIKEEIKESKEEIEKKFLTVFALADDYVNAGLTEPEHKLALVAKLEEESLDSLAGRRATLELVKEAGFKKPVPKLAGVPKLPNLGSFNVETEVVDEDADFLAIFA